MREIWIHERGWDEAGRAWKARGFVERFGAEIEWSATRPESRSGWDVELLLQKLTPEEADFAALMILEDEPPLLPLISDYLERAENKGKRFDLAMARNTIESEPGGDGRFDDPLMSGHRGAS